MDLIIVESPTKAKTLARFLGEGYQIEASMGHVRDLPKSKLGIDIEHEFAPTYVVSAKHKETVAKLEAAAKKTKSVILATDPDREGEAIAWHLAQTLSDNQMKTRRSPDFQRITFHEITESAIKEALAHPGEINMPLVDAQQARRILDRLVGYKLSPLLWRKVRKGMSAGRVQSVAVRLVVEREREIKAFAPQEYWEIMAKFAGFEAKLTKTEIKNKEEADKIIEGLKTAEFRVETVEKREIKKSPYPPFTTSTLQQAASNLFGWSARRTMQIAQNLYEQGLITYHRTDSLNLAAAAVDAVRQFISSQYGQNHLPAAARFFKTKSKVAQEAHEAIRPTQVLGSRDQGLDRDQKRLYELIWNRFVACQMAEAVYEQTGVDIKAGDYLFRANGNKQVFDGWQKLFVRDEGTELPTLTTGQILKLLELVPSQHYTEPPTRYTEASLIKTLEEYGIGRPSTYAPIISTIQDRQYVEKTDKKLLPTTLGDAVTDFLMTNFSNILDYQFTAKMEDELDQIANGEVKWVPVIREFYEPFAKQLEEVGETAARVKVAVETTNEVCPNDGAPLVVRLGRFGKFLACSKFPDCKFTKAFQQKLEMKCPKCGQGDVIIRKTRSKRSFYGCSRYPDCDFASWTKPK
ncbi:MAG: type I DNA topoisomerase [Patescibacteria group bacterium]|nr:type I DNA topoisomerase [Patescibacteria group bacterium]MCL5432193.1 type I DNA topoisomerase [Patescibacteria group bacterium]